MYNCTLTYGTYLVLKAYIHFALMYTTDHIFQVLQIKDLINKDSNLTTPFKLATGIKYSVSYLRVLFCPGVVQKATAPLEKRGVQYALPSAKRFSQLLVTNDL